MVRETHFSSAGPALSNVGGIKCQLFLANIKCFKMELCASVTVYNGTARFG